MVVMVMKMMVIDVWFLGRWYFGGGFYRFFQYQMGLQDCSRQVLVLRFLVIGGICFIVLFFVEFVIGIVFLFSKGNWIKCLFVCDQMWVWCVQGQVLLFVIDLFKDFLRLVVWWCYQKEIGLGQFYCWFMCGRVECVGFVIQDQFWSFQLFFILFFLSGIWYQWFLLERKLEFCSVWYSCGS